MVFMFWRFVALNEFKNDGAKSSISLDSNDLKIKKLYLLQPDFFLLKD